MDYFALSDAVTGSSYGSGAMASTDRMYTCENLTSGPNAGLVMCLKYNQDGSVNRANFFELSVNDGEGVAGTTAQTMNDILFVKRVKSPAGDYTGIYYKDQPVQESVEVEAAKLNARETAAAQAIDRALIGSDPTQSIAPQR